MRDTCKGELTYAERFNNLAIFKNIKIPGNGSLSIEFYKVSWPEIVSCRLLKFFLSSR